VKSIEQMYDDVNGNRSAEIRCLKCFFGPYRSENEDMKKTEPKVYKSANFLAAITSTGRYAAAIEKHKIPIAIQPMNPITRCFFDNDGQ
jgi:hypothetical protein